MSLPAALKPYAALLCDGLGGTNGRSVAEVMRLTPKQVALWFAGPMAERQKAAEAGSEPAVKAMTRKPGRVMRFASADEYRAAFMAPEYADRPAEWWEEKFRTWQQGASSG